MGYYLINRNLLSDVWKFFGIAQRQVYGIGLHRSSKRFTPALGHREQLFRAKLWQAVVAQDTPLLLYLQLSPAAIQSEIGPDSLLSDSGKSIPTQRSSNSTPFMLDYASLDMTLDGDIQYLRAMWQLMIIIRDDICLPTAIGRSLCTSQDDKIQLTSRLRDTCGAFPVPYNTQDVQNIDKFGLRVAQQFICLSSNYFVALAMVYMDESDVCGTSCDCYESLAAAQNALSALFTLVRLFPDQVDRCEGSQIRAYTQAVSLSPIFIAFVNTPVPIICKTMIATLLSKVEKRDESDRFDSRLFLARSYVDRYLDMLRLASGDEEFVKHQKSWLLVLEAFVSKEAEY